MSTTDHKRHLDEAFMDAGAFRELFDASAYAEWIFAGSIRRQVQRVGDVEHVIIPNRGLAPNGGLFAEEVNLVMHRVDQLVAEGVLTKHIYSNGVRWGERYRGVDFRGFNHEIFIADADNLGAILAIRTGPGTYSRMLVTQMQKHGFMQDKGYVWNKQSVICACGWAGNDQACKWVTGHVGKAWVKDPDGRDGGPFAMFCPACDRADQISHEKISVPDEEKYFRICGVPWIPPERRQEIINGFGVYGSS